MHIFWQYVNFPWLLQKFGNAEVTGLAFFSHADRFIYCPTMTEEHALHGKGQNVCFVHTHSAFLVTDFKIITCPTLLNL